MNLSIPWPIFLLLPALALMVLGGGMVGAAWWSRQSEPPLGLGDAGRLQACPETPNCVNSQAPGPEEESWIAPLPAGPGSAEAQRARLLAAIERAFGDRARSLGPEGFDDRGYGRWAVRTPLFGFVDDLELLHDPQAGVFHVRSASRVGAGDGGTNRERVERLRAAVQAMLPGGTSR